MDHHQYQSSEAQANQPLQLQSTSLIAFAAYLNVQNAFKKCVLRTYDYDLNFRQSGQQYVNGKSQKSQSVFSEKLKKEGQRSVMGKSNLTKSKRPKVETIKKQVMPMYHEPGNQFQSKISNMYSNSKSVLGQEEGLPFHISEHSKIPNKSDKKESNSLKIVEHNGQKSQNLLNDTFSQQFFPEQELQPKQTALPMLQKIEHNHMYIGEKANRIQALNQFLLQPSLKDTSKFINNKIDKNFIEKSNKKQKTEGFRIALPESLKKDNQQTQSVQFNHYKIIESRLVEEQARMVPEHNDKSKSKSKSKSNQKQVKDTYINTRKPKLKHPDTEYTLHKKSGLTNRKQTKYNAPQHPKTAAKKQTTLKRDNSNQSQHQVIPVQDYDEIFDKQSEMKRYYNDDQSMGQCEENIKVNALPQLGKNNMSLHRHPKQSEINQSYKFSKGQNTDNPLQFYAIPMQKLKPKINQGSQGPSHQQELQTEVKPQNQEKDREQASARKQVSKKSSRKKIFSQSEKEGKQRSENQADAIQFTEEQMRMILGAKGNKYKEAIIKQYIRINRATKKQSNLG